MLIPIYRNGTIISSFPATESTMFTHALMGAHKIDAPFKAPKILPIQIGDYIDYKGEQFTINTVPSCKKNTNYDYDYQITFEGIRYKLYDKIMMNSFGMSDFTYYGTAADLLELIVINMNQIDSGWSMGMVEETEPQHITLTAGTSCMVALTQGAQQFKLEWTTQGKTINLVKKAGQDTALVFERGKGKGLYTLSRTAISDANVVTRVYGYGSTRNLPLDYRGGIGRLTFAERFIEKNVDLYGIKEGTYTDEEIYPRRLGIVTAVSVFSETSATFTIQDSSLEFNLSDQIIPNVEGLVSFKTGELAGSDFVITGYDHATKTITLRVKDDSGERLPNSTYQAAIGDTFVFLDIDMPQSYIDAAESELKTRTQEYSNENGAPRVAYDLEINLMTMRDWNAQLNPGDRVRAKDHDLGVDQLIRATEISHSLTFPDLLSEATRYSVTISDDILYTLQERIKMAVVQNKKEIKVMTRATEKVKAEIDNARSTLQRVTEKTNFLDTTIDGNVVATGTMIVGDAAGNNNAGITGVVEGDNIRFWAGAPYAQRGIAPWRVLDNGNMYATAGYIGGFNILANSLESANSYAAGKFVLYPDEGYIAFVNNSVGYWAGIGANIFPATAGVRGVARFENTGFSGADNYGAVITAKNGQNNYSLLLTGNIRCMENTAIESMQVKTQVVNGSYTVTTEGAIIVIDNNANITLPANPSNGRTVSINRTHTAVLRISGGTKGVMLRDVYTAPGALTENVWGGTFTYSSTLGYWVLTGFLP